MHAEWEVQFEGKPKMPFIIGLYALLLSDKRKKGKERGRRK